jgi:putative hydrolase of the HAD superfamily
MAEYHLSVRPERAAEVLPGIVSSLMVRRMSSTLAPNTTEAAPDFRHVENWIFDLDNTLYPASSGLFAQIDANMTAFVQELLSLQADEARALQKSYYRDHGTTLNGLMKIHGVDPDAYMAYVHNIDLERLLPAPGLATQIARLRGRRFVFTNGCRKHVSRVLAKLSLEELFDEVWDIRTLAFRPKPDLDSYRGLLDDRGIAPERAAMFDDITHNLVPAYELGMTTVWLKNDSPWSKQGPMHPMLEAKHVHYETDDLVEFLKSIRVRDDG